MQKKIAIFCGGPSSEHEVSLKSSATIHKFIDREKYEPYFFYISKDLKCKLLPGNVNIDFAKIKPKTELTKGLIDLKKKQIFALLAGIHGEFVEDGHLQVLLEYYSIPYSGSGFSASSLCMDKYRSMIIVKELDDLLLPKTIFYNTNNPTLPILKYPSFIKPNSLGSSVGTYKVCSKEKFERAINLITEKYHKKDVLIQEYIGGIELSCGVLEDRNKNLIYLPPIEIRPKKSPEFDYASKYEIGGSEEITPPISLSKKQSNKLSKLSGHIHKRLGCKTYSRSDFKYYKESFYYFETNTLPGMTATSLLPQETAAIGYELPKLIEFIIEN